MRINIGNTPRKLVGANNFKSLSSANIRAWTTLSVMYIA